MKTIAFLFSLFISVQGISQPTVNVTNDCSCISLRSDENFNQLISAIVYTVSWPVGQEPIFESHVAIPTVGAGDPVIRDGRVYQAFAGFGFSHLSVFKARLSPDEDFCAMSFIGANIRLEPDGLYPAIDNTEYYISLNGTDATGQAVGVPCIPTGVKEEDVQSKILVYPNPATNIITVTILKGDFDLVRILNTNGKVVYENSVSQKQFTVEMSKLDNGHYFLQLLGRTVHSEKIIVQH